MNLKNSVFLVGFLMLTSACNLTKKTNSVDKKATAIINLDTLKTTSAPNKLKEYRASVTRVNDIIHTKLEVSFDWGKQYLFGKATIRIKPYFYPTSTLMLNARGMELKEVSLLKNNEKMPLSYSYVNDSIIIQLDKVYKNTEEYIVFIDYVSKPNELKKGGGSAAITDDKGLYFINPEGKEKDKPQQIWTQGETQSNSVWFPTIDSPNERMTEEIYITVDKKYVTLSNGELTSSINNANNTRTDHWKMDLPHPPYLVMMAIGEFAIVKDKWRNKEVNYYVEKEYEPYARAIFGLTPQMMEFFSTKLGVPFQWNKYSQIVVRDYVSGAMENTTATLHTEALQRTKRELLDKDYEEYISHELFHQWFGDLVTCESWSNLPLNESFATYAEYLWIEHQYGLDAADYHSEISREGYFSEAARKQVDLIRFYYNNQEDMFDAHTYNKGGQVLHMLRKYVGDDAFFASLKLYLETNKFNSVEIHNLRLAFEKITGEDLNWFFNQWFLSSGHPELVIKTEYNDSTKKIAIHFKQIQDLTTTPLFKLPMYVDLYVNGKVDRKKVTLTKADETIKFDVLQKPDLVNVDAEKQLLAQKTENKTIKEWAFQYTHGPLFLDRSEALSELEKNIKDSTASQIIITALNDKFWSLRQQAIVALKDIPMKYKTEVKEKILKLAEEDSKAAVRAAALAYLSFNYKDASLMSVYKNSLQDSSYNVVSFALMAIAKTDSIQGLALARQFESAKNTDLLSAVSSIYAKFGNEQNNRFYINSIDKFKQYSKIGFLIQYGLFLNKIENVDTLNSGVTLLEYIAKDKKSLTWVAYYAKKSINDLIKAYEMKIDLDSKQLKKTYSEALEIKIQNEKKQKEKMQLIYDTLGK
ncbi:MAG: M1 family metallopeptidase [Bacteroidia bacterium]